MPDDSVSSLDNVHPYPIAKLSETTIAFELVTVLVTVVVTMSVPAFKSTNLSNVVSLLGKNLLVVVSKNLLSELSH